MRFKIKVGYARVSSTGQNLEAQIELLKKAGCEKIFQEKKSRTKRTNRTELESALDFVREGDIFLVTRLDRCSRNTLDRQEKTIQTYIQASKTYIN